ncbi:hypothetical protein Btus_2211 [Kyrpidia tusciae DSM 2912]|uniref:Uncharacterized protein n=1 Tax=Kyrpidia tusciae (strain DSM 2912 / NBRC 15312 / T2) TaxID=562970 RepID=D5WRT6_KYRT2|nr:hypothetical protein Btus_2211 [Kyrpidia tusciae DSM 2912]
MKLILGRVARDFLATAAAKAIPPSRGSDSIHRRPETLLYQANQKVLVRMTIGDSARQTTGWENRGCSNPADLPSHLLWRERLKAW